MKNRKERELNDEIRTLERETRIKLECRPTSYAHLYEYSGWANLLTFDLKIDDLDIEAHIKNLLFNKPSKEWKSPKELLFL